MGFLFILMIKTAIIVPTLNRSNTIINLLKTLNNQTFLDFILFINDSSNNNDTKEIINNFNSKYKIEYIKSNRIGACYQRNETVKYVINKYNNIEYFIFLDDDIEVNDINTIKEMYNKFESNNQLKYIKIPIKLNKDNYNKDIYYLYNIKTNKYKGSNFNCFWGTFGVTKDIFISYNIWFPIEFEKFSNVAQSECLAFGIEIINRFGDNCIDFINNILTHNSPKDKIKYYDEDFIKTSLYNNSLLLIHTNKYKDIEDVIFTNLYFIFSNFINPIIKYKKYSHKTTYEKLIKDINKVIKELKLYYKNKNRKNLFSHD